MSEQHWTSPIYSLFINTIPKSTAKQFLPNFVRFHKSCRDKTGLLHSQPCTYKSGFFFFSWAISVVLYVNMVNELSQTQPNTGCVWLDPQSITTYNTAPMAHLTIVNTSPGSIHDYEMLVFDIYNNKIQQYATVCRGLFIVKLIYMFRVSIAPIIRSTSNCNCSFWYRS